MRHEWYCSFAEHTCYFGLWKMQMQSALYFVIESARDILSIVGIDIYHNFVLTGQNTLRLHYTRHTLLFMCRDVDAFQNTCSICTSLRSSCCYTADIFFSLFLSINAKLIRLDIYEYNTNWSCFLTANDITCVIPSTSSSSRSTVFSEPLHMCLHR